MSTDIEIKNASILGLLNQISIVTQTTANYVVCFTNFLTTINNTLSSGNGDPTEINAAIACLPSTEATNINTVVGNISLADLLTLKSHALQEFEDVKTIYHNLKSLKEAVLNRIRTPSQGFYEINQVGLSLPIDTRIALGLPLPVEIGQVGDTIDVGSEDIGEHLALSGDGKRVAVLMFTDAYTDISVKILEYNATTTSWDQIGSNIDCCLNGISPRVSLNMDGNTLAIGSPYQEVDFEEDDWKGVVRVFRYNCEETTWNQVGQNINGKVIDERAGAYVSLSSNGRRIVIGSPGNDYDTGVVRVYDYKGLGWVQIGSDIIGVREFDNFGACVSINNGGGIIAAGAFYHDTSSDGSDNYAGEVRLFEFKCNNWVQLGLSIDGKDAGDSSGMTLSLSEDGLRVAIGSPDGSDTYSRQGHVRVFEYTDESWSQLGGEINGEAPGDGIAGLSVSLSGNGCIVAIGAPYNRASTVDPDNLNATFSQQPLFGHVRLFEYNGHGWVQLGSDLDGNAVTGRYGQSVSISKDGRKVAILATGYVEIREIV